MTNSIPIAALIMTGGRNGGRLSSVELYVPSTNTSCSLPSLPVKSEEHSQDGLLLCGGEGINLDVNGYWCHTFHSDSGEWVKTDRLREAFQ